MKLVQHSVYLLSFMFLLITSSCRQEHKTHIIISENLESLAKEGLSKEILFRPNSYETVWTCCFDGRMTFEALDMEVSLQNHQGRLIKRDTLSFQLAQDKGIWCDNNTLVHEAKANKELSYQAAYTGIYKFRVKLLHHKNVEGILALSLEVNP